MLDLESILKEWKTDAEIDRYKLDDTSIATTARSTPSILST